MASRSAQTVRCVDSSPTAERSRSHVEGPPPKITVAWRTNERARSACERRVWRWRVSERVERTHQDQELGVNDHRLGALGQCLESVVAYFTNGVRTEVVQELDAGGRVPPSLAWARGNGGRGMTPWRGDDSSRALSREHRPHRVWMDVLVRLVCLC